MWVGSCLCVHVCLCMYVCVFTCDYVPVPAFVVCTVNKKEKIETSTAQMCGGR